ncbi:MAG: flagellin [Agathobacter sp.]|nr:flagellin [Agathobacter sp.]
MQINRNMSAVITNNQLLRTENKLAKSMERLSSGLKINHASDNPAGIAISNKMKAQIDALDQAESNASDGISVLQIADGALNEVAGILQRMRELSVQAANGTNAYVDRVSMQNEIDELKKEVDRISRDTEYNTKELLDGSSDVRVYGENATRFSVSESVSAQVYKMNVTQAATQATVELPYEAPEKGGRVTINGVVVNIIGGMTKEAYLEEVRDAAAEAGCTVSIEDDKMLIKSDYYGYDETIEFYMDKEMGEKIGATLFANPDCAYEITEAEMKLPKNPPAVAADSKEVISINGVDVVITPNMDPVKYEEALRDAVETAGLGIMETADGFVVKSGSAERELIQFSYSYDLAVDLQITDNYVGDYTVNTHGTDAVVEIPESDTDVNVRKDTGFTATTTVDTNGNRVTITDNNGFSIGFLLDADYPKTAADPVNGNFEIEVTDIGSLTIQVGANEHQDMDVRLVEVSTSSLYVDTVDVAVAKGADRAMVTLDEAIASLSAARSRIGAFQNRLEYASTSLAATGENMTAAYSGILDTDMATEMTEYTQQNILSQAAISVLSQANELPQQVLSLLQ